MIHIQVLPIAIFHSEFVRAVLANAAAIGAFILAILPIIGIYLAFRGFRLKRGVQLRGSFVTSSSIACEDDYVSSITIENTKDRAVTVFGIYLQLGYSTYILVEDFEDEPRILHGFETFHREYEPLDFYSINFNRLKIDSSLKNRKIRKRLVVSTSAGKYVVRKSVLHWSPTYDFFRNHFTAIGRPVRSTYKNRAYGANALYAVTFRFSDSSEHTVPIYRSDHQIKKFRLFNLTEQSLESKASLESYLKQKQAEGFLNAASLEVFDLQTLRQENEERISNTIELRPLGFLAYHVYGPVMTWLNNRKTRRRNLAVAKKKTANST